MYNDDSTLVVGKYKNKRLADLPAEYLLSIYESRPKKLDPTFDQLQHNKDLMDYIESNLQALLEFLGPVRRTAFEKSEELRKPKPKPVKLLPLSLEQRQANRLASELARKPVKEIPQMELVKKPAKAIPDVITHVIKCSNHGCPERTNKTYNNLNDYMAAVKSGSAAWTCPEHLEQSNAAEPNGATVPVPSQVMDLSDVDPYTDKHILTKGKHKFTALCRVDPEYLLDLHLTRKSHELQHDLRLVRYVELNFDLIKDRMDGKVAVPSLGISTKLVAGKVRPSCKYADKLIFPSEKDAKSEIRRIRDLDNGNDVKPVRTYECTSCGGWHLTSMEKDPDDSDKLKLITPRPTIYNIIKHVPSSNTELINKLRELGESVERDSKILWRKMYAIIKDAKLERDLPWTWRVLDILFQMQANNYEYWDMVKSAPVNGI